jgi:hypothetical protein
MNEFIEKNRALLHYYCISARAIGWMILLMGVIHIVWYLSEPLWSDVKWKTLLPYLPQNLQFIFGLLLLGTAQFIRYISEKQYQPGWLLRHGDKLLYLYAFFQIIIEIKYFADFTTFILSRPNYDFANVFQASICGLFLLLFRTAIILILVGLAQVLRRILPVIEESKTLV